MSARGNLSEVRCRRCRFVWVEIDDTVHTNGTGHAHFCHRCLATKFDRTYEGTFGLFEEAKK